MNATPNMHNEVLVIHLASVRPSRPAHLAGAERRIRRGAAAPEAGSARHRRGGRRVQIPQVLASQILRLAFDFKSCFPGSDAPDCTNTQDFASALGWG